jgi:tryptophan synthase alpha chain
MRKLFFPYLLANYPDPQRFADIVHLTLQYADAIEIGLPFSDPVADGPVIANAASRVLEKGFEIDSLFRLLQQKASGVPVALMSYANPILAYGQEKFLRKASESGVRHLIVPDVPFEESEPWRALTKEYGMNWISFIALTTREERLRKIAQASEGFIYLLALKGITGSKISAAKAIIEQAQRIRAYTKTPVALGFGVKSVQDTAPFCNDIDALIVGSKIIELIDSSQDLESFFKEFRNGL